MSQILDSFERSSISYRGYVHGKSAKAAPPVPVSRFEKFILMAITMVVGALAVIFLGMVFGLW